VVEGLAMAKIGQYAHSKFKAITRQYIEKGSKSLQGLWRELSRAVPKRQRAKKYLGTG